MKIIGNYPLQYVGGGVAYIHLYSDDYSITSISKMLGDNVYTPDIYYFTVSNDDAYIDANLYININNINGEKEIYFSKYFNRNILIKVDTTNKSKVKIYVIGTNGSHIKCFMGMGYSQGGLLTDTFNEYPIYYIPANAFEFEYLNDTGVNFEFKPHSDISLSDKEILEEHDNLIKEGEFEEATNLLDDANFSKGIRASFFNLIEEKIKKLQIIILNKLADQDEYYSLTEPTEDEMEGKTFWIQPFD